MFKQLLALVLLSGLAYSQNYHFHNNMPYEPDVFFDMVLYLVKAEQEDCPAQVISDFEGSVVCGYIESDTPDMDTEDTILNNHLTYGHELMELEEYVTEGGYYRSYYVIYHHSGEGYYFYERTYDPSTRSSAIVVASMQ